MPDTPALPNTLSQLLTNSLTALEKAERNNKYTIDLKGFYQKHPSGVTHQVSLAGALYASLFNFSDKIVVPRHIGGLLQQQLQLVEFVSHGMLDIAWVILEPETNPKFLESTEFYKSLQDKDLYKKNPKAYKQAIAEFIVLIKESEARHVKEDQREKATQVA
jgi:hypothetical protein